MEKSQEIRELAYKLWERNGCPEGNSDYWWECAINIIAFLEKKLHG